MATFVEQDAPITPADQIMAALAEPSFGKYFTDHLVCATWTAGRGWQEQMIVGQQLLRVHPGLAALHYGQEIFEGLKAYRHADGSVWLFRPERNAARFAGSARRMAMPPLPETDFVEAVTRLTELDAAWVPASDGDRSLYLRPFMFASETLIGVREANRYTFLVLATPAAPFYPDPLRLWVTPTYSRAAQGGTGMAKCGGNYGASMAGEREAHEHGCNQVLWLDSAERRWVEECGTMNILLVTADDHLVTPALGGTILDGITRDSLLRLAPSHHLTPVERPVSLDELRSGVADGTITEVLACGTAAVVSPVVGLQAPDWELTVADGRPGSHTMALREHLTDIQFGRRDDPFGWTRRVI